MPFFPVTYRRSSECPKLCVLNGQLDLATGVYSLIWRGYVAGQGMGLYLSVLYRVYKFV